MTSSSNKDSDSLLEDNALSKPMIALSSIKSKLKSAPNEGASPRNVRPAQVQFLSKDSDQPYGDFSGAANRDFAASLVKTEADCESTKPSQVMSCHSASVRERANASPLKDSLHSFTLAPTLKFLGSHKDSMNLQRKEGKSGFHPKNNGSVLVTNSRLAKQTPIFQSSRHTDNFCSPANTIKGLLSEEDIENASYPRVIGVGQSPGSRSCVRFSPCISTGRNASHKSSLASADERSFKTQVKLAQVSSFYKGNRSYATSRVASPKKKPHNCYNTPRMKGYEYYREIMDRNFRRTHTQALSHLEESQFSYHPEILPASKKLKPQTPHEMSYEPTKKKQEKVKVMRKEIMDRANKEYTFAPGLQVDAYNKVSSKLRLKDEMNTYLERVRKENAEKARNQKLCREMRELEELAECTHTPKTNRKSAKYKY
eukprot:TRINITY_DN7034_c0_g1_i5.p1 TRINITY_DN7034_c0_g1~~TRINITY_DN7034_c0_g1_i5.p1  ORF type:complete len:427 (-),score=112.76 TRINITY_DN7034_c0_g1_i5:162-1442(-)